MPQLQREMIEYYARRAAEYERIYAKPERQGDLRRLEGLVERSFEGLNVLEVACGTGYWTRFAARGARSILASDCNEEVLEIARQKAYGGCRVEIVQADAYALDNVPDGFNAGLAAFWWSHIARADLPRFLRAFHAKLTTGSPVLVLDNRYVEGSSTSVSRRDDQGNTYQIRRLLDGSEHEVLKNFPDAETFAAALANHGTDLEFTDLPYYWIARYRVV